MTNKGHNRNVRYRCGGTIGRTKEKLDAVIAWLTGCDIEKVNQEMTYGSFFENAPMMNPRADLIKGKVCGIAVESIEDPLMKNKAWKYS